MDRQGISQQALADMTGIPRPRLSEWLSGKRPRGATEKTINAVFAALGMEVTDPKELGSPLARRKRK
jgi:transcriptional regulator with XRE-family HTH domain